MSDGRKSQLPTPQPGLQAPADWWWAAQLEAEKNLECARKSEKSTFPHAFANFAERSMLLETKTNIYEVQKGKGDG